MPKDRNQQRVKKKCMRYTTSDLHENTVTHSMSIHSGCEKDTKGGSGDGKHVLVVVTLVVEQEVAGLRESLKRDGEEEEVLAAVQEKVCSASLREGLSPRRKGRNH